MLNTVTKCFAAAALLVMPLFEPAEADEFLLAFVVFAGAIVVAVQGIRMQQYAWAVGFAGVAVVFNPLFRIPLSSPVLRWIEVICMMGFLLALASLKPARLRSTVSITELRPRRESL
jgi:uncharacterized membrane protein YccC